MKCSGPRSSSQSYKVKNQLEVWLLTPLKLKPDDVTACIHNAHNTPFGIRTSPGVHACVCARVRVCVCVRARMCVCVLKQL